MLSGNLEYIISSLPNLSFTDSETVQHEVNSLLKKYANSTETSDLVSILNEEAKKFLSEKDFQKFQQIQLKNSHQEHFQKSRIEIIKRFSTFIFQLKQELKTYRINRKSKEPLGKINYGLIQDLPENPLEAELYLLQKQWQKLEELSLQHYSDLSALVLYKLKLEVLLRWWNFDKERGYKVFQETLNEA